MYFIQYECDASTGLKATFWQASLRGHFSPQLCGEIARE